MGQDVSVNRCVEVLERLNVQKPYKCKSVPLDGKEHRSFHKFTCLVAEKWLHEAVCCGVNPSSVDAGDFTFEERVEALQPSVKLHDTHGLLKVDLTVIKKSLLRIRISEDELKDIQNLSLNATLDLYEKQIKQITKDKFFKKFGINDHDHKVEHVLDDVVFTRILREIFQIKINKLDDDNAIDDATPFTIFPNNTNDQCRDSHIWSYSHANLHLTPILGAVDTAGFYVIIEPSMQFTLHDVVSYSPSSLSSSTTKLKFTIFQMLHILSTFSNKGFCINEGIGLRSINTLESPWLFLSCTSCLIDKVIEEGNINTAEIVIHSAPTLDQSLLNSSFLTCNTELTEYTVMWVNGEMRNFDYLMVLNHAAGRRQGDPHHHPIMPWVIDFTSTDGNYRDLKQSKFRLNKGDSQLDVTYHISIDQMVPNTQHNGPIPHHLSDLLSDVTYYIYLARKTPKSLLQSHVRQKWVPGEYPISMERIYEWTPEECIPEFYSDPTLFYSCHDDLPDLKIPHWCDDVPAFLNWHLSILESDTVSQYLHHWIDLTFGYQLTGQAAIAARNVHLSLHDRHDYALNAGVLQLFNMPHPVRRVDNVNNSTAVGSRRLSSDYEFVPLTPVPKLSYDDYGIENGALIGVDTIQMEDTIQPQNEYATDEAVILEHDDATELKFETDHSRISQPTTSKRTNDPVEQVILESRKIRVGTLSLPSDVLNFTDELERVEALLNFQASSHCGFKTESMKSLFGSVFDSIPIEESEMSSSSGNNGIEILICWIIELVVPEIINVTFGSQSLDERVKSAVKILNDNRSRFPKWLYLVINELLVNVNPSLLQENDCSSDLSEIATLFQNEWDLNSLASHGSPTLYLSPHFNIFSFPTYFPALHSLLSRLFAKESMMETITFKVCSFREDSLHPTPDSLVEISRQLHNLLTHDLDLEGSQLVLSFLNPLFLHGSTKHSAYLHFFQPISHALGPLLTGRQFLKLLQNVYDDLDLNDNVHCQFYGQPFISKVMNAFGLQVFLNHFIGLLIDALLTDTSMEDQLHGVRLLSGRDRLDTECGLSIAPSENVHIQEDAMMMFPPEECWSNEDIALLPEINVFHDDLIEGNNDEAIDTHAFEKIKQHSVESNASDDDNKDQIADKDGFEVVIPSESLEESQAEIEEAFNVVDEDNSADYQNDPSRRMQRVLSMSDGDSEESHNGQETTVNTIKWLLPWLGPSLTSKHLVSVLIKKLPRLYSNRCLTGFVNTIESTPIHLIMQCFTEVGHVFGEAIVLHQFLPFIFKEAEGTSHSTSSVSVRSEGGLLASTALLQLAVSILKPPTLVRQMELLSSSYFQPLIRQLATLKPFASGCLSRGVIAYGLLDVLSAVCSKLDRSTAQDVLSPILQQFFSCFDGIYRLNRSDSGASIIARKYSTLSTTQSETSASSLSSTNADYHQSTLMELAQQRSVRFSSMTATDEKIPVEDTAMLELYETFNSKLAYKSYVMFCRALGNQYVESTLYNNDLIWQLCANHDDGLTLTTQTALEETEGLQKGDSIGDIEERFPNPNALNTDDDVYIRTPSSAQEAWESLTSSCNVEEDSESVVSSWQHLEGSWIDHWKDSIGDDYNEKMFCFNSQRLQTYAGHSSAVRDIHVPENEHYFLSASKDKTVKLWLLKNHGNGTAQLACSRTFEGHVRPVFAVQSIDTRRQVVSCDGALQIWDPISGTVSAKFELGKNHSIVSIRTLPSPNSTVAIATSEGVVRLYDVRQKSVCEEWKIIASSTPGIIRCMCTNESATWLSVGFSSGIVSVVDLRTGLLRGQWRAHDTDISQLASVDHNTFLSASHDFRIKLWKEDGHLVERLRNPSDVINSMHVVKRQCLWSTGSNLFGIHNVLESKAPYIAKKITHNTVKGNITCISPLPINHLHLIGSDNGNVTMCS